MGARLLTFVRNSPYEEFGVFCLTGYPMVCNERQGQRTGLSRRMGSSTRKSYRGGTRMLAIDADSHFVEPLDLFERRIIHSAVGLLVTHQPPSGAAKNH